MLGGLPCKFLRVKLACLRPGRWWFAGWYHAWQTLLAISSRRKYRSVICFILGKGDLRKHFGLPVVMTEREVFGWGLLLDGYHRFVELRCEPRHCAPLYLEQEQCKDCAANRIANRAVLEMIFGVTSVA